MGFTSAEELAGWEVADLMPGTAADGWGLESILRNGVIRDAETEMLRKDGRHIMVEFSASLVSDGSGNPQAILGVGKDITKRKISEWLLQKAKTQLEQRSEQLQASQIQLRKLAGQVITVHEEERRIISQELHDDAGQALITLKHSLGSALEELSAQPEALRERLLVALRLVDRTMALIRSLSHRLRPPALDVGGLNLSLMELCRECREQTRLQIDYAGQELPGLPDDIAISLYRVTQEAITNVLKHADATRVQIALAHRRGRISLTILDDGRRGHARAHPPGGIGLLGMQERLNMLGGELKVEPNHSHGYRLTALVPWKPERRARAVKEYRPFFGAARFELVPWSRGHTPLSEGIQGNNVMKRPEGWKQGTAWYLASTFGTFSQRGTHSWKTRSKSPLSTTTRASSTATSIAWKAHRRSRWSPPG